MKKKKVDGNRTLGENICDSGGLAHSWTAYKNSKNRDGHREPRLPGVNYTEDQLFFITYGQVRSDTTHSIPLQSSRTNVDDVIV